MTTHHQQLNNTCPKCAQYCSTRACGHATLKFMFNPRRQVETSTTLEQHTSEPATRSQLCRRRAGASEMMSDGAALSRFQHATSSDSLYTVVATCFPHVMQICLVGLCFVLLGRPPLLRPAPQSKSEGFPKFRFSFCKFRAHFHKHV